MSQITAPSLLRILSALFYDFVVVMGLFMITGFVVLPIHQAFTGQEMVAAGSLYLPILLYLVVMLYVCGSWRFGGQTIGMKAWKFQLVTIDEQSQITRPNWKQLLARFFLAQLSIVLAGFGYWMMLWTRPPRLLHDQLSHTRLMLLNR